MVTASVIETPEGVIEVPADASEAVKKAIARLQEQIAKDVERKAEDIFGGAENKTEAESDIASFMADVLSARNIHPKLPRTSIWVEVGFDGEAVSKAELFSKVTRVGRVAGEGKSKTSSGNGRKSIRDLALEKFSSEPKSYQVGDKELTSVAKVLDEFGAPYYRASDADPKGDAPQRQIIKFARENPDIATEIAVTLQNGQAVTLAEIVAK